MMETKGDISTRKDIEQLVDTFYKNVLDDSEIAFFFTEVIPVDFDLHKPKLYDFWETMILFNPKYQGNPMGVHKEINAKHTMTKAHFDVWVNLFHKTIDDLFIGEKAEEAKTRSQHIATTMRFNVTGA